MTFSLVIFSYVDNFNALSDKRILSDDPTQCGSFGGC